MNDKRRWSRVHLPDEDYELVKWLSSLLRKPEEDIVSQAIRQQYVDEIAIYNQVRSKEGSDSDPDHVASTRPPVAVPTP